LVEVRTRYTLELYRDYYWFSLFRGKKYRQGKTAFHIISVLMFLLMICSFIWLDVVFTRAVTTAMSAICVLFYLMAFTRPKRYVKRSPVLFETDTEFVFNNDSFITIQTGDITNGTSTTRYEALYKVYETNAVFYMYLTPVQALLISKCDIIKGTPKELQSILSTKLAAKKYIKCK